jgi:hypothetical protein
MIVYLYAKRHRVTGLRYFGKTKNNPYTYKGSGTHWKRHLATHGNDVETTWVQAYEDETTLVTEAEFFSKVYDIVNSTEWANLTPENGLDGKFDMAGANNPMFGRKHTDEVKQAHSERMSGRKQSIETIANRVAKTTGQKRPGHSEKMKAYWAKRKNLNA